MADSQDRDSIAAWFARWSRLVAAVDFAPARALFADDVAAFGTFQHHLRGLDALEAEQWRQVWPTIEDFRFEIDTLVAEISPDRLMAYGAIMWSSIGLGEDGSRFDRPGRCTVVLRRGSVDAPWQGIHTHFSLGRGVPQKSHGKRKPQS